jgi:hypothetical protein
MKEEDNLAQDEELIQNSYAGLEPAALQAQALYSYRKRLSIFTNATSLSLISNTENQDHSGVVNLGLHRQVHRDFRGRMNKKLVFHLLPHRQLQTYLYQRIKQVFLSADSSALSKIWVPADLLLNNHSLLSN